MTLKHQRLSMTSHLRTARNWKKNWLGSELNAQLDLENAKAVDADLSGPEEERETDDRMESAAIVAEDKGAYPADREGRTR